MLDVVGAWASIAAFPFSVIGILVAIRQVAKVKAITEAEREQRVKLQAQLVDIVVTSDASAVPPAVSEVLALLESGATDRARMRISDLRLRLVSVRDGLSVRPSDREARDAVQQHVIEIADISHVIDQRISTSKPLNVPRIRQQLERLSDSAHSLSNSRRNSLGGSDADS